MKHIIKYKIFESENKFFQYLPVSEYTKMVRKPDIACFDERDIKVLSDFFRKNNIKYQFKDASLLPLPPLDWAIDGDNDIDIHIEEKTIKAHLTDGSVKPFDLRDYIGFSYEEIDAIGEIKENWFTLHNFSLVIPKDPIPIVILKCYGEYYIVDMGDDKISSDELHWRSYLCDQLDGLIECLSHLNIQNEKYKHGEYLYSRIGTDDLADAMNRDVEVPSHEMRILKDIIYKGKEIIIEEGRMMRLFDIPNAEFGCCESDCFTITIMDTHLGIRGNEKTLIEVFRTDDEYYMVNVRFFSWRGSWGEMEQDDPECYKCDSVDGLVQFIDLVITSWL